MDSTQVKVDMLDRAVGALEALALAHVEQVECANQTARRLWRVGAMLMLAGIGVAGGMATRALGWLDVERGPAVAVIPVEGRIGVDDDVEAARLVPVIDRACADPRVRAVLLRIDSGGGSPMDAQRIGDAIARCGKPTEAHVLGSGTSAAYLIAMHTDWITANRYATVGGIGAVARITDMSELATRLGVSERTLASSERKAGIGPLGSMTPAAAKNLAELVDATAAQFHADVQAARGDRLRGEIPDGEAWLAGDALALGLVDELGSLEGILRARHPNLSVVEFAPDPTKEAPLLERLVGAAAQTAAKAVAESVASEVAL